MSVKSSRIRSYGTLSISKSLPTKSAQPKQSRYDQQQVSLSAKKLAPQPSSCPTKKLSLTPTFPMNQSQTVSKYDPPMPSGQNEWPVKLDLIQTHFYERLTPPSSRSEAKLQLDIHTHCLEDYQVQIDIVDLQLKNNDCTPDAPTDFPFHGEFKQNMYQDNKVRELRERKGRLMSSMRFHKNARMAYWYCLEQGSFE